MRAPPRVDSTSSEQDITHACLHVFVFTYLPPSPAGYASIQEVQQHPFFAGVNWQAVRDAAAPKFVPRAADPARQDLSLDWELTSLFRQPAAPAVKYEYLQTGATV